MYSGWGKEACVSPPSSTKHDPEEEDPEPVHPSKKLNCNVLCRVRHTERSALEVTRVLSVIRGGASFKLGRKTRRSGKMSRKNSFPPWCLQHDGLSSWAVVGRASGHRLALSWDSSHTHFVLMPRRFLVFPERASSASN